MVLLFSGIIISIFPSICRASQDTWRRELLALQGRVDRTEEEAHKLSKRFENGFPIQWDWLTRDAGQDIKRWIKEGDGADFIKKALVSVLSDLGRAGSEFRDEFNKLCKANVVLNDRAWFDLYVQACEKRREIFLRPLLDKCSSIVFTKHSNLGGSHYAYTEAQSDAQNERNFTPGASLCILQMDGIYGKVRTLIEDANGVIRDPDVSYDGQRILFAWKKSDRRDDYHLYEMEAVSGEIRQLTFGLGFADYEGAYLPNGDIIFSSTRCVQTVDCWWTEVSNLYTCDKDGGVLRRLSFDATHTNFPTVTTDGRVLYTRG